MKFYHGTSQDNWEKIQKEGVLFGCIFVDNKEHHRVTYLAVDIEEARCYGDIVLEVEYNPHKNKNMNNYCEDCWQLRVYEPIPLSDITIIEKKC